MLSFNRNIFGLVAISALLTAVALFESGCASGEGGAGGAGTGLSGAASAGPVHGATVTVYAIQNNGQRGAILGATTTDSNGVYAFSQLGNTGPILISVTGGSYVEEGSGTTVALGSTEMLAALTGMGSSRVAAVTPLTHVAAVQALQQAANGQAPVVAAVSIANSQVAAAVGLSAGDITASVPANPYRTLTAQSVSAGSDSAKHALFLAALSTYANTQGQTSMQVMATLAGQFAGTAAFASALWTQTLPQAQVTFLASTNNVAGFTVASRTTPIAAPKVLLASRSCSPASSSWQIVDDVLGSSAGGTAGTWHHGILFDSSGAIYVGGSLGGGQALRQSADNGKTWQTLRFAASTGAGILGMGFDLNGQLWTAGVTPASAGYLDVSSSGTTTPSIAFSYTGNNSTLEGWTQDGAANMYAVGEEGTYPSAGAIVKKSTDGGNTWSYVGSSGGVPFGATGYHYFANATTALFAIASDHNGVLFTVGYGYSTYGAWFVLKSVDQGATWTLVDASNTKSGWAPTAPGTSTTGFSVPYGMLVDANNNIFVYGLYGDVNSVYHWLVRKSSDSGASWSTSDDVIAGGGSSAAGLTSANAIVQDANGNLYVSGRYAPDATNQYALIRRSTDDGATWSNFGTTYNYGSGVLSLGGALGIDPNGNLYQAVSSSNYHWTVRKLACQ